MHHRKNQAKRKNIKNRPTLHKKYKEKEVHVNGSQTRNLLPVNWLMVVLPVTVFDITHTHKQQWRPPVDAVQTPGEK